MSKTKKSFTQRSILLKFLQRNLQISMLIFFFNPASGLLLQFVLTHLHCDLVHFPKLTATELVLAKLYLTWLSPSSAHCFSSLQGNEPPRMEGAILLNPLLSMGAAIVKPQHQHQI